jgi:propanol-preferring alcohol dehydrogenase
LRRAKIEAGQRLAIFGIGGLGHLAVQIGHGLGAVVTAIDVADDKLAYSRSLGADRTLNAATEKVVKELRALGGVHVALVTSAAKAAYDMAFPCIRPGGTLLVVGLPSEPLCFAPIMMAASEVHIQASSVGTRQDTREMLVMAAAGKVRCQVKTRPLAEVNEVFEELRRGSIPGRIVLVPHSP